MFGYAVLFQTCNPDWEKKKNIGDAMENSQEGNFSEGKLTTLFVVFWTDTIIRIILVVLFKVFEALGEVENFKNVLKFAGPTSSFEDRAHIGLESNNEK